MTEDRLQEGILSDELIELLFKELKQTLKLQSFFGTNEKAVKWQIWAALIAYLGTEEPPLERQ